MHKSLYINIINKCIKIINIIIDISKINLYYVIMILKKNKCLFDLGIGG